MKIATLRGMRKFIKEYFSFTRSELRIIVILAVLILLSLLPRMFFRGSSQPNTLTAEDHAAIDSFIQSLEKISFEKSEPVKRVREAKPIPKPREFDPNTVTTAELEEVGFPAKIGGNLIRYRKAGGKFKAKADFKKLYGISDSLYTVWERYIVIEEMEGFEDYKTQFPVKPLVELNAADSVGLLEVSGIGPYFAGKIIQYRNRLGGFLYIEQLMEIWGMDTGRIESIRNQVSLDSLMRVKMDINTITKEDLRKHPYVSSRMAESIQKYLQFAGSFKSVEDLLQNRLLSEDEYTKLRPYLTVGE